MSDYYDYICGNSLYAPYIPGETKEERHTRRVKTALKMKGILHKFCRKYSIGFKIREDGEQWHLKSFRRRAEWRPRTAMLVFLNGMKVEAREKCYDVKQAINRVKVRWSIP